MVQRRLLLALGGLGLLSACGFKLRTPPELVFRSLYISATPSTLTTDLARYVSSLGNVRIVNDPATDPPEAILDILSQLREKTVVGVNASGQVREFQLRLRVRFRLRTPAGKELIPETELLLQRDISFNESAVLAKEAEEGLLYRDMQSDIVQQLLRRLAAVKSLA